MMKEIKNISNLHFKEMLGVFLCKKLGVRTPYRLESRILGQISKITIHWLFVAFLYLVSLTN